MIYDQELARQAHTDHRRARRRVWDYTILLIALLLTIGFCAGYWAAQERYQVDPPNCPAEDSCRAEYFDGAWHITEDPDH